MGGHLVASVVKINALVEESVPEAQQFGKHG